MKKAMPAAVLATMCGSLSGGEGTHANSVITCWTEPSFAEIKTPVFAVKVHDQNWHCTIQYEDPSTGYVHNHELDGSYHKEWKECKAAGKDNVLTADLTVNTAGSGQIKSMNITVSSRKCGRLEFN